MSYLFLWKVPKIVEDYYFGPCLFLALHHLYKNAYLGQRFQLSGSYIQDKNLKQKIEQLSLDIKKIIFRKIREKIESKKGFIMKIGELLFDFALHYLIVNMKKCNIQSLCYWDRWYNYR